MPRVLFLTRYTEEGSSSRYRVYQYLPFYSAAGFGLEVQPFHTTEYVQRFSGSRDWRLKAQQGAYYARRAWQRLGAIWRSPAFDLVVVEGEVFPFAPAWLDRLLWLRNRNVVVEYDDALHVYYGEMLDSAFLRRLLGGKVATLMRLSKAVIVGNTYLADYARKHSSRVEVVPTTVDTRRYRVREPHTITGGTVTLGWIGSPVTAPYLTSLGPALAALAQRRRVRLKVIGGSGFSLPGVQVLAVPWHLDTEVAELQSCDIGLMPLDDDAYARGKCGLKILQYFAVGIPAVASPVGVNAELIQDGLNGFLAGDREAWVARLTQLIDDPTLRQRMGQAGRQRVEQRYALEGTAPRLVALLRELSG